MSIVVLLVIVAFCVFLTVQEVRQMKRANVARLLQESRIVTSPVAKDPEDPPHVWIDRSGPHGFPPSPPLNFRTMMWGESNMVRRVSATQWETKIVDDWRRKTLAELRSRLVCTGPGYEPCAECNTDERRDGKLHRRSCSKYSYADEESAIDRCCAADQLESLQEEPAWKPVPEKLVAAYETAYQRYLALGR